MKIKLLLASSIFALCACQPEQTRWRNNPSLARSSAGEMVFQALSKSVEHHDKCLAEREVILSVNEEKFIHQFNNLSEQFVPKSPDKHGINFIGTLTNLQEKDILDFANLIEKISEKIINMDCIFIDKIFSLNDRALEVFFLGLVHDEDFEKSLESLLIALKSPNTTVSELALLITPILQRNMSNIDMWDLLQKIVEALDDKNANKKIAHKLLKLINKFNLNPEITAAALALDTIISEHQPSSSLAEKIAWLKEFNQDLPDVLKLPDALKRSPRLARFGMWVNKKFHIKDLPPSLNDFLEKIINNEEAYNLLITNTNILVNSGILQDIIELSDMVSAAYPKADFQWVRSKLVEISGLDHLDPQVLNRFIKLLKSFFPPKQPLAQAPIVFVGNIVFQLLAANNHNQCVLNTSSADYAEYLKKWCEEVVSFMRDSKNGLIPLLQTLKSNL